MVVLFFCYFIIMLSFRSISGIVLHLCNFISILILAEFTNNATARFNAKEMLIVRRLQLPHMLKELQHDLHPYWRKTVKNQKCCQFTTNTKYILKKTGF